MNFSIIQEKMSLNLLKREVEKDIEVFDAKKLKLEHSKPKKKSKSKFYALMLAKSHCLVNYYLAKIEAQML